VETFEVIREGWPILTFHGPFNRRVIVSVGDLTIFHANQLDSRASGFLSDELNDPVLCGPLSSIVGETKDVTGAELVWINWSAAQVVGIGAIILTSSE